MGVVVNKTVFCVDWFDYQTPLSRVGMGDSVSGVIMFSANSGGMLTVLVHWILCW